MVILWAVLYVATFIMAYGVLPIMRDYWKSGEFSRRLRIATSRDI